MQVCSKMINQGLGTKIILTFCSPESPCDLDCPHQPMHKVHELVPRQPTVRGQVAADQGKVNLTRHQLKMLCNGAKNSIVAEY